MPSDRRTWEEAATLTDLTSALRATSDALLRDLEVLTALEEEKRSLPLDDPQVAELSDRIEDIAQRILASSTHQRQLSDEVTGAPIEAQPRPVAAILAEWRDAERARAQAEPGSAEALEADLRVRRARDEYRAAFDAASHRNLDPGSRGSGA
jgi:hypothetical protein